MVETASRGTDERVDVMTSDSVRPHGAGGDGSGGRGGLKTGDRIDSTSDERTANNSTRQTYRVLSDHEKEVVAKFKELGARFIEACHEIGGTDPAGERLASRDLSLAVTHMEDACMRAVRHVTK